MKPEEFRGILQKAVHGDHEAFEQILEMYEPLINKYCRIDGKYDEDLRQSILLYIALCISKFGVE